jgi:hypothetical protein
MEASHWNPRFTPIAGHWRMLSRNLGEHLSGDAPTLGQSGAIDPRTGITPGEQQVLLHAIDVWWLYAGYAGLPKAPLYAAAVFLLLASLWAWANVLAAARAERAP